MRIPVFNIFKEKRFSLFIIVVNLMLSAAALYSAYRNLFNANVLFPGELYFCISMCWVASIVKAFSDKVVVFRAAHVIHYVFIIAAVDISQGDPVVSVLLMLVFMGDTSLYMDVRKCIIVSSVSIAGIMVLAFREIRGVAGLGFHILSVELLLLLLFSALSTFILYYREKAVKDDQHIHYLENSVENLAGANKAFQSYADNVESASRDKERNRITRELHDITGYAMTNICMLLNAGLTLVKKEDKKMLDVLHKSRELAEAVHQDTRNVLHLLRSIDTGKPVDLNSIYHLTKSFQEATGVEVEIGHDNLPKNLGDSYNILLYRLIQESLTNSFKHGRATHIKIMMQHISGTIQIGIRDNGIGDTGKQEGIGLAGIRERLNPLGGVLKVFGREDGYELKAIIPWPEKQNGEH